MCGITGIFSYLETSERQQAQDAVDIKKMTSRLARRGPDEEGFFQSAGIVLGHRRLSIIDLSQASAQPFSNEIGQTIVFNGVLYNYLELKEELKELGYEFRSNGDTEVLLTSYRAWGKSCLDKFRGIFAFAIWDQKKQELFLARDKLGVKPLYYCNEQGRFYFSSTLPSLLCVDAIPRNLDLAALHMHFHLHSAVPWPRTLIQSIKKLGPGQYLTLSTRDFPKIATYFALNTAPKVEFSGTEWVEKTQELLWKAVYRQCYAADVPVGVLLSGGLDSSLLVAILGEFGWKNIPTFSIGFDNFKGQISDEFEFSDQVAKIFSTDHHKLVFNESVLYDLLPEAILEMSEPMVSTDVTAFYLLSREVKKQGIKVILTGQGADEILSGYFWYQEMDEDSGTLYEKMAKHYLDRTDTEYRKMIHSDYCYSQDATKEYIEGRFQDRDLPFLTRLFDLDVGTLMVEDPIKRVDNMTMAFGLEARVPFLDDEFVTFCRSMPSHIKSQLSGKAPLKKVAEKFLPNPLVYREKGYFPIPSFRYLSGKLLDSVSEVLYSPTCLDRNLFRRDYLDQLRHSPPQFTPIGGNKLWHLALLEMWLQAHKIS